MENYRPKTAFASFSDHLLRVLLAGLAGTGWFVSLWGLSLPALTAGLAFGGLIWLCARSFGKKSVQKREALMRQLLGGELALNKLLLCSPRRAAFQAALWLAPKAPATLQKATEGGVIGVLNGQTVLIRLIAQHPSLEVTAQQVVEAVKATLDCKGERCFLCLTAPLSREAARYAETAKPHVRVVTRDEMIRLAGACSPATDEALCQLKRQKPKRLPFKGWLEVVLHPSRSKRYFWYGAGLSLLTLWTGQGFYALPALVCLSLFTACKLYRRKAGEAPW